MASPQLEIQAQSSDGLSVAAMHNLQQAPCFLNDLNSFQVHSVPLEHRRTCIATASKVATANFAPG